MPQPHHIQYSCRPWWAVTCGQATAVFHAISIVASPLPTNQYMLWSPHKWGSAFQTEDCNSGSCLCKALAQPVCAVWALPKTTRCCGSPPLSAPAALPAMALRTVTAPLPLVAFFPAELHSLGYLLNANTFGIYFTICKKFCQKAAYFQLNSTHNKEWVSPLQAWSQGN